MEKEPLTKEQVKSFWENGFLHIPGFLSLEEVKKLRVAIKEHFSSGKGKRVGSGYVEVEIFDRIPQTSYLKEHPKVKAMIKQLVGGGQIAFTHETAAHLGAVSRGWHKDTQYNLGQLDEEDWTEDFKVIHAAYYLQDHKRHSGALSIKQGSNHIRNTKEGKPIAIKCDPGELILFDIRSTHSGNTPLPRGLFSWIPSNWLHPVSIRRRSSSFFLKAIKKAIYVAHRTFCNLPFVFYPYHRDRIAIFILYGANNYHTQRYFEYLKSREDYAHFKKIERIVPLS